MNNDNRNINGNTNNRRRSNRYSNQKNYRNSNYRNYTRSSDGYDNRNKNGYYHNYSTSKQQSLQSDEMKFSDELDTSFVDGKRKKKEKIVHELNQSYEKEQAQEKKVLKKKLRLGRVVIALFVFAVLFMSVGVGVSYFFLPKDVEEKVVTKVEKRVVMDENIVFLGDSITDFYDLEKYYPDLKVVNSGVDGNLTEDILEDMEERVYQYNPSKVILLIGTNDIQQGFDSEEIISNIEKILENIKENRPYATLYLQSIYPVVEGEDMVGIRTNQLIYEINQSLESYCEKQDITYIDLYPLLLDPESSEDMLEDGYTEDGLHLNDSGYEVVTNEISKYIK